MNNTIIYLIGHYGVGKFTIARAIAEATGARVFDNHLANNVIFSLIREDGKTKIPERAWDLIMTIRRQALVAMTELARPEACFILTNALMDADPMDRAAFSEVQAAAEQRRACFVPVTLLASDAAHDIRIPSPDREQRLKMTDADGAKNVRATRQLLRITHPHHLTIDTTDLPPPEAARVIIDHAERLA
ncbi:hypothetical protein GGR20_002862 [Devosia subaequoris]|uniref:AAA family ATPase n=1 Tax=Devosia subaequoris TaxID=395930 RepID=A0A7W6IP93_9HYPH|nr:hypothetical protein [Devosia subaequoris]MBB4053205.1 hypothetical protein [Devosia subaequoris]MCP1210664.1 hypothetical protein [Devosia subaequoris]